MHDTSHIGSSTGLEQGAFGGEPTQSFPETNSPFLEQGKHRLHNLL
jgi:hypothetical protein